MTGNRPNLGSGLRIVWAITAKDMVEALKNKTTLVNIAITLAVVIFYRLLPNLASDKEVTNLLVYDAGSSTLVTALEGSSRLSLYTYSSQAVMEDKLSRGDVPELGLVIPVGFDRALASGEQLQLEGYLLHWVKDSDAAALKALVEGEIVARTGQPARIELEGNRVYPQGRLGGLAFTMAISLPIALLMMGIGVVPQLMFEEKQARTLDVLLVSPASSGQVVLSKALTGLFYCLVCVVAVFVLYPGLIVHWSLAILAAALLALFASELGLLMGIIFDTRQQFIIWTMPLYAVLLLPAFLTILGPILPGVVNAILPWVPTVTLVEVLFASCGRSISWAAAGQLAYVAVWTALVLAAVAWFVRRSDR